MQISQLVFAFAVGTGFVLAWFIFIPSYLLRLSNALAWPQFRHLTVLLAGAGMIAAGTTLVIACTVSLVRHGGGTPVPFVPARRLVCEGIYRWSRNPMYMAYLLILFGEALYFGSGMLLLYSGAVFAGLQVSVVMQEEPELRRRYGIQYEAYSNAVPRWF